MPFSFDLDKRNTLFDDNHIYDAYRLNLAKHRALLSGDSSIVRRFYRLQAFSVGTGDIYKHQEIQRTFFHNARFQNAFVYAGLIPWTVESIVRLVANSGFTLESPLQTNDELGNAISLDMVEYAKEVVERIDLQGKFERGVYLESGIGDFAYRISYDKSLSDEPLLEVIEPQFIEPTYKRGMLDTITIKESTDDIQIGAGRYKHTVEIHEKYTKRTVKDTLGAEVVHVFINYSFWLKGKEVDNTHALYEDCKKYWNITDLEIELPFDWFPVIFKKNNKKSELYRQERGVPDIQGLDSAEDALSEVMSNSVDAVRKAAPKTFVPEDLLPTDIRGKTERYSAFDHEYLILGEAGIDPSKILLTTQANINWQAFNEISKFIISHAINKAGLSPTTLGVTGLESINSSVESQDAREKPSLRTRREKLKGWKVVLEDVINKYFKYMAWVKGEEIGDYANLINVSFNEYINPSTENVTEVLARAIAGRVYSIEVAVEKNFIHEGKEYTLDDIIVEAARIRGITPDQEMALLGLIEEVQTEDLTDGDEPDANQNNQPTGALKEGGNEPTTTGGNADNE